MKSGQKGFGAVTLLVVIIVIALVGTAGWLVYDRQNNGDSNDDSDTVTSASNEENGAAPSASNQNSARDGFYEIPEWGIKIALRDYDKVEFDINNSESTIGNDSTIGSVIPTFKLEALQSKLCSPSMWLYRSDAMFTSVKDENQTKVGDFHYAVVAGNPSACSDNAADNKLNTQFLEDIYDMSNFSQL